MLFRPYVWLRLSLLGTLAALGGCQRPPSDTAPPRVAAANGYLEAAVRDVLGNGPAILALAEPGMCPGHFDLRPSQVENLRQCRLVARFGFQDALDAKLNDLQRSGLQIISVQLAGGLCEPDTYVEACRQVADGLVRAELVSRTVADEQLAAVKARMAALGDWAQQQAREHGLTGRSVAASRHQAAFCRFLGLDVVATFSGADATSVSDISQMIREAGRAAIIVANLPEGRGLADALAERLGAKVVVFGNFPDRVHHRTCFDDLVRENVQALLQAAPP